MPMLLCHLEECGHPMIRHDEHGRCWAAGCINDNQLPCTTNNNPATASDDADDAVYLMRGGTMVVEVGASSDAVHHPSHYRPYYPGGPECIDVTGAMGFNVGNAVKYLWRAGRKTPDAIEDLRKALVYVQFEIDRLNREKDA
jgi:hypothetical protein